MPVKKVPQSDGSTILVDDAGVRYLVPAPIKLIPGLTKSYKQQVQASVEESMGEFLVDRWPFMVKDIGAIRATSAQILSQLFFKLQYQDEAVGWATFDKKKGQLVETGAVIAEKYRRKGVYTAFLRALKNVGNPVILSDTVLSVANALQWMKNAAYDHEAGRFRLNPKRKHRLSTQAIHKAIISLFIRSETH